MSVCSRADELAEIAQDVHEFENAHAPSIDMRTVVLRACVRTMRTPLGCCNIPPRGNERSSNMNARPVPVSPDDIDVAWLNAAMGHGRTPYASVRIEPVAGGFYGASARVTATASEHSQPPTRFFAKCASPSPALRESLGRSGVYRNEYDFYTRLADAFPVRVPRCHFAYYDPASHHTLLLLE